MLGYLRAEAPGVLEPPDGGWYDTGDIVELDAEGFVTIKGRAKRFAKVAGEMVPLGTVEDLVARVWPAAVHAVVAAPDPKRGRTARARDRAERRQSLAPWLPPRARPGCRKIFVPRSIVPVAAVPILGTGKIDYVTVGRLASQSLVRPTSRLCLARQDFDCPSFGRAGVLTNTS
jgi:acyl-[acyl-carrier-protein]-phospholipid O-acyltransferase/long-chain-fatty-acid--[acyl-carrier-protein] ligase